jgi:hypothetical protein
MSRARPAVLAVLLVVAAATAAVTVTGGVTAPVEPADDPVVGTSENSTRVLLLTGADAAAFDEPDASVTDTLEAGYGNLGTRFQLDRVEHRLAEAENSSQRRAILGNATDWADSRLDQLRERERAARAEFAAGEITATEYVVELGTVHAEASRLVDAIGGTASVDTLYDYAGTLPQSSDTRAELSQIRTQLVALEGPVRQRVADVVHGDRDSVRVHVTAGNGLMVSTIDDGEYVRSTYRPDNLGDGTAEYGDSADLVYSYYPWVSNNSRGSRFTLSGQFAIKYNVNHPHGSLESWVSTASDRVYVERQTLTLAQLPGEVEHRDTAGNVSLSTTQTYAGGPLLVRVANATGDPIDTSVSVNGSFAGNTGADGRLWVLSPAGDYPVSTTYEGETLAVNVTARPAP